MNIERLELTHFGKFHLKTINFTPGLNVVYGRNEAGKSTIHAFIRSMLFGMPDSQEGRSVYERYLPWETPGEYEGKIWLSKGGHRYRVERGFLRENAYLRVTDETTGEVLEPAGKCLKELLEGLTESSYLNTICIEQLKGSTQPQLADELKSLMVNTGQSKSIRINVEEAKAALLRRREALRSELVSDVDGTCEGYERQMAASKSRVSKLQRLKYVKDGQYEELTQKLEAQKKQADEDMLSYERERDVLRRQYEAAQKAYESAPQVDENDLHARSFSWLFMLVLTLLFFAGAVYMYMTGGMETRNSFYVITFFACMAFICLVGVFVAAVLGRRKKQRLADDYRLTGELRKNLKESMDAFEECKGREPLGLEERCKPLLAKKSQTERETEYLRHQLAQEQKIHDSLRDQSLRLQEAAAANRRLHDQIDAVNLALKTINRVAARIHDTFGNLLNAEASRLLAQVTGGKYDKLTVSGDMKVIIFTQEREVPLESVSRGTVEQIYLCIRVAAAKLLWQKEPMPFLFDDVFVYYDDDRLEAAMRMLKSCGHQTIIFSCHQREDRLL